jgi:hypothetical protein
MVRAPRRPSAVARLDAKAQAHIFWGALLTLQVDMLHHGAVKLNDLSQIPTERSLHPATVRVPGDAPL